MISMVTSCSIVQQVLSVSDTVIVHSSELTRIRSAKQDVEYL